VEKGEVSGYKVHYNELRGPCSGACGQGEDRDQALLLNTTQYQCSAWVKYYLDWLGSSYTCGGAM
jgi:hypothetical protein